MAELSILVFRFCRFSVCRFQLPPGRPGWFPAIVNPKPIRRVAPDRLIERLIHVAHDRLGLARSAIFVGCDFRSRFDAPVRRCDAITNSSVQSAVIAQRENCRRRGGGTLVAQKRNPQTAASLML